MARRGLASWTRETRLLILTLAVSIAALVVLARFRFPAQQPIEPPPQPLERLAARATYDELASIVERLERRIAPSLVVLRLGSNASAAPKNLQSLFARREELGSTQHFAVALRVRPDVVVTRLVEGTSVQGVLGDAQALPLVIAADPVRQIALVRVPPPPVDAEWAWQPAETIAAPRYVVAVEGSRGGATPRPIFLGRADRIDDVYWRAPLLVLSRTAVTAEGSFIFTLDGTLIGMAMPEAGVLAVVPAALLRSAADSLFEHGSPALTDFGLSVHALTPELAKTLGSVTGVVVSAVAERSPAAGKLRPGDLIQTFNGQPVATPEVLLLQLATLPQDRAALFAVRRGNQDLTVEIAAASGQKDAPSGQ